MPLLRPLLALALLAACRPAFPPVVAGGLSFEESPGVRVTIRDCIRTATYTVAVRQVIEQANPADGLVLIFYEGPSRYLGRSGEHGYALVGCEDWPAIAGLVQEDKEGLARP